MSTDRADGNLYHKFSYSRLFLYDLLRCVAVILPPYSNVCFLSTTTTAGPVSYSKTNTIIHCVFTVGSDGQGLGNALFPERIYTYRCDESGVSEASHSVQQCQLCLFWRFLAALETTEKQCCPLLSMRDASFCSFQPVSVSNELTLQTKYSSGFYQGADVEKNKYIGQSNGKKK